MILRRYHEREQDGLTTADKTAPKKEQPTEKPARTAPKRKG